MSAPAAVAKPCYHCIAVRLHRIARAVALLETATVSDQERASRRDAILVELTALYRMLVP